MSQEQESCASCRFWRRDKTTVVYETGYCRLNPPTIVGAYIHEHKPGMDKNLIDATNFPVTFDDDWCGKWERKA